MKSMVSENKKVAIISAGGKQHLVEVGSVVTVNRLSQKEGETIELIDLLQNEPVAVKVIAEKLGTKINGLKFKNKVRYMRRYGHRQRQSVLEVLSIGASQKAKKSETAAETPKVTKTKKVTASEAKKTLIKKAPAVKKVKPNKNG